MKITANKILVDKGEGGNTNMYQLFNLCKDGVTLETDPGLLTRYTWRTATKSTPIIMASSTGLNSCKISCGMETLRDRYLLCPADRSVVSEMMRIKICETWDLFKVYLLRDYLLAES